MTTILSRRTMPRTWLATLILLAVLAIRVGLWLRPPTATTMRELTTACRRDYVAARSAHDSLAVDERVWQLDQGWRRIPSCGELRRHGSL